MTAPLLHYNSQRPSNEWAIEPAPQPYRGVPSTRVWHPVPATADAVSASPVLKPGRDTFGSRRTARRAALVLALFLAAAGIVTALLIAHGIPDVWWPQTGNAFTSTAPHAGTAVHSDACDLIVGPARDYCQSADSPTAPSADDGIRPAGVVLLVPVVLGFIVLLCLRRRTA
ncbi:hypothetical protein AB0D37_38680 [Streptomyces sp. NPDC048384]|uniref:hypothetical protein n=1 Tax=Streptomyces sp. NPDC048384 TaxID=3155487 RepID=UPI00342313F0